MSDLKEGKADAWAIDPPSPELRRLDPLVGSWHSQGRTQDSMLGPGVDMSSDEQFYWLDGGYFLVQTYRTTFGSEPMQSGINYWYYDSASSQYGIIFFSNNGTFTEDGNRYFGRVSGDALTMTGPARFRLPLDSSGSIARGAGGAVTIDWYLRNEEGEFQRWFTTDLVPA